MRMKISLVGFARIEPITQPPFADYEPPTPLPNRPRSKARNGGAYASRARGDAFVTYLLADFSSRQNLTGLARQRLDYEMFERREIKRLAVDLHPSVLERELVEAIEHRGDTPDSCIQTAGKLAHLQRSGETSVRAGSQRARSEASVPWRRDLDLERVWPSRCNLDRPLGGRLGQFQDNRLRI